jgi:glucose/arabinose dehydrogenase
MQSRLITPLPGAEIWAYGLRNPWRFAFDTATGDLYIGDVGQNAWEEIDFQPAGSPGGLNYGWDLMEGSHPYAANQAPGTVLPIGYRRGRCSGSKPSPMERRLSVR